MANGTKKMRGSMFWVAHTFLGRTIFLIEALGCASPQKAFTSKQTKRDAEGRTSGSQPTSGSSANEREHW